MADGGGQVGAAAQAQYQPTYVDMVQAIERQQNEINNLRALIDAGHGGIDPNSPMQYVVQAMQAMQAESRNQTLTLQALAEGVSQTSKEVKVNFGKLEGKLKSLKDKTTDWRSWSFKFVTSAQQCCAQISTMLDWALSKGRNEVITADMVEAKFGANGVEAERVPDVHTWDKQLFGLLAGLCGIGSREHCAEYSDEIRIGSLEASCAQV